MFFFPKKVSVVFISLIFASFSVSALLTATTVNTIKGNAPTLSESGIASLKNSINFSIKKEGQVSSSDKWQYNYSISPGSDNDVYLSLDTQFNNVIPSIQSGSLTNNDIDDTDGDAPSDTNPYIISNLSYSWADKDDTVIANTSTNLMGSDICTTTSSYVGPFKLTITFDVVVNTKYGDPYSSDPITITRTFNVHANDGICYVRPGVLALNEDGGWPEGNNQMGAGRTWVNRSPSYNSDTFVPHVGFKAWGSTKFPTIAFEQARFKLIPKNTITNYSFTIKDNPNGTLEDQQQFGVGQFKFGDITPSQSDVYTLEIKPKDKTNVSYFYNFKLKSSRSWFWASTKQKTQPITGQNYTDGVIQCGGASNLPTRAEFTNSIYATTSAWPPNEYASNNGFMRDFGNLTAEWGHIYYYAPGRHSSGDGDLQDMMVSAGFSNLKYYYGYWYYWTNETGPGGNHRSVGIVEGNVGIDSLNETNGGVICIQ